MSLVLNTTQVCHYPFGLNWNGERGPHIHYQKTHCNHMPPHTYTAPHTPRSLDHRQIPKQDSKYLCNSCDKYKLYTYVSDLLSHRKYHVRRIPQASWQPINVMHTWCSTNYRGYTHTAAAGNAQHSYTSFPLHLPPVLSSKTSASKYLCLLSWEH